LSILADAVAPDDDFAEAVPGLTALIVAIPVSPASATFPAPLPVSPVPIPPVTVSPIPVLPVAIPLHPGLRGNATWKGTDKKASSERKGEMLECRHGHLR
jgi:hypothetical protein